MFTKEETYEALVEPRIGDYFTEMYTYHMIVLAVDDSTVKYVEASPPPITKAEAKDMVLPYDGKLVSKSRQDFVEHFIYGPDFRKPWIRLADRDVAVAGWLEYLEGEN
jgi:hypothetical protein